jgi:hypothetical protein
MTKKDGILARYIWGDTGVEVGEVGVGEGVYEFNADAGGNRVKPVEGVVVRDYGAASARVFCVYPKELAKPVLSLEGRPVPRDDATLTPNSMPCQFRRSRRSKH